MYIYIYTYMQTDPLKSINGFFSESMTSQKSTYRS